MTDAEEHPELCNSAHLPRVLSIRPQPRDGIGGGVLLAARTPCPRLPSGSPTGWCSSVAAVDLIALCPLASSTSVFLN